MSGYDVEAGLRQLQHARATYDHSFREMAAIVTRAADAAAADQWPDPKAREQAGLGCVVAAAMLAGYADRGQGATMLNGVGLFGLALVESARTEGVRRPAGDPGE